MKRLLLTLGYFLVRQTRGVRRLLKIAGLKLRGVDVDFSCAVHPLAVFEPSGGTISVGKNTYIDRGVIVRALGGSIYIGPDCSINAYSVIYGGGGLRIGRGVRIAPHTVIVPANHVFADAGVFIKDQGLSQRGILIEDDVWIGAGARILDGVILKRGTVVGAGSVVTKSTAVLSVVAGVPARQISTRS
jgi:acetyltransferase-like isoleucine patch superfamily enzyme